MIRSRTCFSMLLLAVLLLSAGAEHTANAAPAFTVQDQRFVYPLPETGCPFSFFVFSTEGNIAGSSMVVREVKTADGESPSDAV